MNRRSFFGALVGGIAAATGVRSLIGGPARWTTTRKGTANLSDVAGVDIQADRVVFLKGAAAGRHPPVRLP